MAGAEPAVISDGTLRGGSLLLSGGGGGGGGRADNREERVSPTGEPGPRSGKKCRPVAPTAATAGSPDRPPLARKGRGDR